jgi:phage terminase large subunit-like protein
VYKKSFADNAVFFINQLKHTTGEWKGKNFELIAWQEQIIRDLFGIVRRYDECRQFRRAYIEIPKKNGKSELAAAVALLLMCTDLEHNGAVFGCATDRQQASLVFDVAVQMVEQLPAIFRHVKIMRSQKRMIFTPLNAFYQVLSAEAYTKDGLNAHGIIFDELHAQPDRRFFDTVTSGSGIAREQPLTFIITTAGFERDSICYELHKKAEDVLRGKIIDPTFYPVIYGAAEDDDWTCEKTWKKANPSYGITIKKDGFRAEFENAKLSQVEQNKFRRLHLNQWVKQSVRWMPMELWDTSDAALDIESLAGRSCYGGLDLSSSNDMSAFVLVFPPDDITDEEGVFHVLPFYWIPEYDMKTRIIKDRVPYDEWHMKGFLEATEGNVINYKFIQQKIGELDQIYDIKEIAYDRWGAEMLVQCLTDEGIFTERFGMGYSSMSSPTKEVMRLVKQKRIAHGGHPILRWNFDNIVVQTDEAGNIKPDKKRATERIDGAVAMIMALARATGCETPAYENNGMLVLDTNNPNGYYYT